MLQEVKGKLFLLNEDKFEQQGIGMFRVLKKKYIYK